MTRIADSGPTEGGSYSFAIGREATLGLTISIAHVQSTVRSMLTASCTRLDRWKIWKFLIEIIWGRKTEGGDRPQRREEVVWVGVCSAHTASQQCDEESVKRRFKFLQSNRC